MALSYVALFLFVKSLRRRSFQRIHEEVKYPFLNRSTVSGNAVHRVKPKRAGRTTHFFPRICTVFALFYHLLAPYPNPNPTLNLMLTTTITFVLSCLVPCRLAFFLLLVLSCDSPALPCLFLCHLVLSFVLPCLVLSCLVFFWCLIEPLLWNEPFISLP